MLFLRDTEEKSVHMCVYDQAEGHHKINMDKYTKYLLIFHSLLFCTLILDWLSPCPLIYFIPVCNIQLIYKILTLLMEYAPDMKCADTIISSLLVVWTFMSAIIIFYMEKKDQLYCGIRQWEIALFDIKKKTKYAVVILFFAELLILVAAPFCELPVTISYFCFLYPVTALCILTFVAWVTGEAAMLERYISLLGSQYRYDHPVSGALEQDIPALYAYLKRISDFHDDDWERVLKIISAVFMRQCRQSDIKKRISAGKYSYEVVKYILQCSNDTNAKKKFIKRLAANAETSEQNRRYLTDILTALLFPAVEIQNDAGRSYYIIALSAVKSDETRQELLMRGAVYARYLNYVRSAKAGSKDNYSFVSDELINMMAEGDRAYILNYMINFALHMGEYYPDFKCILADISGRLL